MNWTNSGAFLPNWPPVANQMIWVGLLLVASIAGTGFVLAQIDLPPARISPLTTFLCTSEVAGECNAENATAELFGEENRVDVTLVGGGRVVSNIGIDCPTIARSTSTATACCTATQLPRPSCPSWSPPRPTRAAT